MGRRSETGEAVQLSSPAVQISKCVNALIPRGYGQAALVLSLFYPIPACRGPCHTKESNSGLNIPATAASLGNDFCHSKCHGRCHCREHAGRGFCEACAVYVHVPGKLFRDSGGSEQAQVCRETVWH